MIWNLKKSGSEKVGVEFKRREETADFSLNFFQTLKKVAGKFNETLITKL